MEQFHPLIQKWFAGRFGSPTDIQLNAWPVISQGSHALITAPTGSGKTLTAFLWSIDRLITGKWPLGTVRVLYISPLKALNNDVQKNLLDPLSDLKAVFEGENEPFPEITVLARSGDTPSRERLQMQRKPPAILITTPESLNILLASHKNRTLLQGVATVILDEIHSVLGGKRGIHLITAVDRLVLLSGEFQRIGLTATIRPVDKAAAFLGGYRLEGGLYRKRDVVVVQSDKPKKISVQVSFPEDAREKLRDDSWWDALIDRFKEIILSHRSTLFFANSRRLVEKVARLINENEEKPLAYSHHGSLSRELRMVVEKKLKAGELPAIIATNSLELGIDIGAIDEVVLIQTPPALSSAVQRIGRAGHSVDATSYARIFPTHGRDFLEAVVTAEAVSRQDIEEIHPLEGALDVLAQILVAMTSVQVWNRDELYTFIKTTYPYHDLNRDRFDLVLEMLAGRYADTRIRELKPRVTIDQIDNTVEAKEGVRYLIYLAGGTIPDRGYYTLRIQDSKAKIGELDEEFVWERSVGETFTLGNQTWRIQKIDHKDVEVLPAGDPSNLTPFWKAERRNRDFYLSEKISTFLEEWNGKLDRSNSMDELQTRYSIDTTSAGELLSFLRRQKKNTGTDLPHRYHLLIEHFKDAGGRKGMEQVVLHTLWGGKVNQPFAVALSQAWEDKYNFTLEVYNDDDAIMLLLPDGFDCTSLMNLVKADKLDSLLRRKLEKTGFFGARFREAAGTALLLPRAGFKKRTPFWLNRLRSKKLLASVLKYEDFPILVETWRACLQDEFDIPRLTALLDEIRCGIIKVTEVRTNVPSPFSSSLIWRQTNFYMYEDDTPKSGQVSRLRPDFIKEALVSYRLRPELPPALIKSFVAKLQRTAEGYAPSSARELLDWLKERLFIPAEEWKELIAAIERDYRISGESLYEKLAGKAAVVEFPGSESSLLLALENLTRVLTCLGMELDAVKVFSLKKEPLPAALLEKLPRVRTGTSPSDAASAGVESLAQLAGEWLRYYGPLPIDRLMSGLGIKGTTREELVEILTENQSALVDIFTRSSGRLEICDTENLERMLYINRSASRPSFKALDVEFLPLFMSAYHGLTSPEDSPDGLKRCLERLFGYSLPAELWETEIFPSRLSYYQNSWIDSLMTESDLIWLGTGKGRITFCFKTDIELFNNAGTKEDRESESLFPDKRGRYGFWELAEYSGQDSSDLAAHLWRLAWKGRISNDSFAVIRKGIESRFKAVDISRQIRPGKRFGYGSWQSSRPLSGTWFMLDRASGWNDPFEREEVFRGRIQLLLERYGILFREILSHELPGWRWGDIFRSLRLMELSGEIMSGHFFKGIPGIQFIAPSALRLLNRGLGEDHVYWLNAMDPASPCGMGLEAIKGKYPARLAGNHMVFHGRKMVMSSTGLGAKLIFNVEADHPGIPRYLEFFKNLLNRRVRPPKLIRTGTINGIKALESPYRDALLNAGFSRDYRSLVLRAQYR